MGAGACVGGYDSPAAFPSGREKDVLGEGRIGRPTAVPVGVRAGQAGGMIFRGPSWWSTDGEEPDPRWTLANERTLLAYERTALGLLVAGLAATGSRVVAEAPLWLSLIGLPLIVLSAAVALEGRGRFLRAQRAMRNGDALTAPAVVSFLPWGIAAVAAVGLVAAAVQLTASA